jgi:glycosyltransferase involved in cell wall biosynthesis
MITTKRNYRFHVEDTKSVLWWGRSDLDYSRNRIVLRLFSDLGFKVNFYHPLASRTGLLEAYLRRLKRPDLIWVPCFRQRDISSAVHWADKWKVPLVIDPLISAYEKAVFENKKWPPDSSLADRMRRWESRLLRQGDLVVADTTAHAKFFTEYLEIPEEKLSVLYVGAEAKYFIPKPYPLLKPPFEILFYGSFLPLQGVDIIIKAAQLTQDLPFRWVLLGDGPLRREAEKASIGLKNINFEPWIDYKQLPNRIANAHILLGVFGTTKKANLVIPNKVFQSMAVGRPVITRNADAYNDNLGKSDIIGWVPGGDPDALASRVKEWLASPDDLIQRGAETFVLFDKYFAYEKLKNLHRFILEKIFSSSTL